VRVLLLVVLGAIAALGVLRATELLLAHKFQEAIIPMALGVIFAALFVKQWSKRRRVQL